MYETSLLWATDKRGIHNFEKDVHFALKYFPKIVLWIEHWFFHSFLFFQSVDSFSVQSYEKLFFLPVCEKNFFQALRLGLKSKLEPEICEPENQP